MGNMNGLAAWQYALITDDW